VFICGAFELHSSLADPPRILLSTKPPRSDNVSSGHHMKINRTQVIGALILAALVLFGLLLRYWKFSG
jgi:hypothetical protein